MKNLILAAMSFLATAQAYAGPSTCDNGAVLRPGMLSVECSVIKSAESPIPKIYQYEVSDRSLLGGFAIEIPANVAHPEDFDTHSYIYNFMAYNSSNNCAFPANQQLMLVLRESRPFCNPPVLGGDPSRQTCAFPKDPNPISAHDLKPIVDGQALSIFAKNAELSIQCNAEFKANASTIGSCQYLTESSCTADANCKWVKTAYPACYSK